MLLHVCTCYISTENYFKPLGEVYLTATIYLFHFFIILSGYVPPNQGQYVCFIFTNREFL